MRRAVGNGSLVYPSSRAWILCGLLFFATALSFLDRQVLSVLAPQITVEFGMSNSVYARVVFAFVLSYTVMFSLGGRLMDVLGTRLGLALSVGLWSLASAAHSLASGPWSLGAARFFLGIGEGACFPAATKGAVEWIDPGQRSFAVDLANGGSALGAVLAPPLSAWWAASFGWRGAFIATAILGVSWLVAWQLAFRGYGAASGTAIRSGLTFSSLLSRGEVRRLLLSRFFFDPVFYFYMFWIPQYLARVDLDLGRLWTIGEAWLNGKPLGVLWTAPFRVDCTDALGDGVNELILEVTNTWYNRLVGDAALPAGQRITRTNVQTSGDKPWAKLEPIDSGLMGPVRLITRQQVLLQ